MILKYYSELDNGKPIQELQYMHYGDAGFDIRSKETVFVKPDEVKIVKTGLYVVIPYGYELQIRPRSGLSAYSNLRLVGMPATIDSGYRGEITITVTAIKDGFLIKKNDRIAQGVIQRIPNVLFQPITKEEFDTYQTNRTGGLGSTGVV